MNITKGIAFCLMLSFATAFGNVRGNLLEFADVRYERGALVLTTHKSQWRLVGRIGDNGVWKTLPAGSDIVIPLDEKSGFIASRHQSFRFLPLMKGDGFVFVRQTNLLSLGKGLKEESFTIEIGSDGKLTYGEVSVRELTSADIGKSATKAGEVRESGAFGEEAPGMESGLSLEPEVSSAEFLGRESEMLEKEGGSTTDSIEQKVGSGSSTAERTSMVEEKSEPGHVSRPFIIGALLLALAGAYYVIRRFTRR